MKSRTLVSAIFRGNQLHPSRILLIIYRASNFLSVPNAHFVISANVTLAE
jgi:hypothetical protein